MMNIKLAAAYQAAQVNKTQYINEGVLAGYDQNSAQGEKESQTGNSSLLVPEEDRLTKLEDIFGEKALKKMGIVECATCASRTYQDESDDSGVSFQAPTHLSPAQAASAVMSHEMEHVVNEQAQAKEEGKEVIGQSVQIFRSVCPECGKSYVSGGVTKTTTAGKSNPYGDSSHGQAEGNLLDMSL